jgi:hypothetical protein
MVEGAGVLVLAFALRMIPVKVSVADRFSTCTDTSSLGPTSTDASTAFTGVTATVVGPNERGMVSPGAG